MNANDARAIVRSHSDYGRFRSQLVEIAQQESPETDLLEAEPRIHAFISDWVAPRLRGYGFKELDIDSMGNLVARVRGSRTPRSLLLLCHAMNHAPEGMADPYSGEVVDGRQFELQGECVWGRGLAEQKSSLAAVLAALDLLHRANVTLGGTLVFGLSTAGECGRHLSVEHMVDEAGLAADAGILCGATDNIVGLGNYGRFDMWVTVHGRASHLSLPWLGQNALTGAGPVMDLIGALTVPATEHHPVLGTPTITMHAIESVPFFTHTIPAAVRVAVDRRMLPGTDPIEAYESLAAQIPDELGGFKVTKELGSFQYPSEVDHEAPIVRALADAYESVTGRDTTYTFNRGALDAGYFNTKVGMPMAMFGPGAARFSHSDAEMVSVEQAFEAMQIYAQTALMYLC